MSNFEAGGQKSQDRTEPLVGARVLLAELDDRMELVKPNGELTTPPAADASTGREEG